VICVQGSQGYGSTESDFVDIESFPSVPDTSLPELNLQVPVRLIFIKINYLSTSVSDPNPDPPDPHVFGPPGSGSTCKSCGS
jgi:hypothetical protein